MSIKTRLRNRRKANDWLRRFEFKHDGVDRVHTYSIDFTVIMFLLPIIKKFKEVNDGYPYQHTWESWNETIQKIIDGWQIFVDNGGTFCGLSDEATKKVLHADELFFKHFHDLWW